MINYYLLQFAQTLTIGTGDDQADIPALTADQVLQNGLNIVYFILGIIAIVIIIIGGITYATSAGNASSVTKAKNMILYAVVGFVVVISAYAITNFVIGRF